MDDIAIGVIETADEKNAKTKWTMGTNSEVEGEGNTQIDSKNCIGNPVDTNPNVDILPAPNEGQEESQSNKLIFNKINNPNSCQRIDKEEVTEMNKYEYAYEREEVFSCEDAFADSVESNNLSSYDEEEREQIDPLNGYDNGHKPKKNRGSERQNCQVIVRIKPRIRTNKLNKVNKTNENETTGRGGNYEDGKNIEYKENCLYVQNQNFSFDKIFSEETKQIEIYSYLSNNFLNNLFEGYNCTIFAYGQTGSGKTFTMGFDYMNEFSESVGILPRFLNDMFNIIERKKKKIDFDVSCTYIEIYNEEIIDLIDFNEEDYHEKINFKNGKRNKKKKKINKNISIREDINKKEIILMGIKNEKVQTVKDVFTILQKGNLFRTTERTFMNDKSSRSHAIFTVNLIQRKKQATENEKNKGNTVQGSSKCRTEQCALNKLEEEEKRRSLNDNDVEEDGRTNDEEWKEDANSADENNSCNNKVNELDEANKSDVICSKFHFVDLAGSERAKRTETKGHRFKEGISINYGLLSLSNVIYSLSSNKKSQHIPYRNSKLTRILQDSLGGNSKTVMIACISIDPADFYESLSTIKYAARTKKIKNTPVINYDINSVVINDLRKQLFNLNVELKKYKIECKDKSSEVDFTRVKELASQNKLLLKKVKSLKMKRKKLICLIFYYMTLLRRNNCTPMDDSLRSNVEESARSCSVSLLNQNWCISQGGAAYTGGKCTGGKFPSTDGKLVEGDANAIVHSGDRDEDNANHIASVSICKKGIIMPDASPTTDAPTRTHITMSVDSFFQKRDNLDKENAANVNSKLSEPDILIHGDHCSKGMVTFTMKGTPRGEEQLGHLCGLRRNTNEHLVEKNNKKEHDMNIVVSSGSYEMDTGAKTCNCVEGISLQKRDDQTVHMNKKSHDNRNNFQESVMCLAENADEGNVLTSMLKYSSVELSPNVIDTTSRKDAPNGDILNGQHSLCTTCQKKHMVEEEEDACDSDFNTLEKKYLFINLEEDKRCVENMFRQFELNRYNEKKLKDLNKKYNSIFEKNKVYEKKIDELKKMVKRMKRCAKLTSEGKYDGKKRKYKKTPKDGRGGRSGRGVGGGARKGLPKRQYQPDGTKNLLHSSPNGERSYKPKRDHFSDVEFERKMKSKMLKHFSRKKNLTDTEVSAKENNSFCTYGTTSVSHGQTRLMDLLYQNLNYHKRGVILFDNPKLNTILIAGKHKKGMNKRETRRILLSENNDSVSSNIIYSSNNVDWGLFENTAEGGVFRMGSSGRRGKPINGEKRTVLNVLDKRKKKQVQRGMTQEGMEISHPYDNFPGSGKMDNLNFVNYARGEMKQKWHTSDEEMDEEDDTCENSPCSRGNSSYSSDDESEHTSGNVSPKFLKNKLNKLQKIIKEDICKIKRVNREKEEYNAKNELLTNSIMSLKKKLHYLQVNSQNNKNCKKIENMKGEIQRITNEKEKIQKKLNDNEQQIKHLKVDILKMKNNFLKTSTLLKEEQRKHTNIIRKKENIITKLHEREEHYIEKLKKKEEISKQAYSKLLKRNQELNEELKMLKKKGPSGDVRRSGRKKDTKNIQPEGIIHGNKFDDISQRVKKVASDGICISSSLHDEYAQPYGDPDDGNNGASEEHREDATSLQNDDINASPISTILSDGAKSAYLNSSPSMCKAEDNLFSSHSFYNFNNGEYEFQSSFKNDVKIKSYLREFMKRKMKLSSLKAKLEREKSTNRQVRKILQALYVRKKNEEEERNHGKGSFPQRSPTAGKEERFAQMSCTVNEGNERECNSGQPMVEEPLRNTVTTIEMEQYGQKLRDNGRESKEGILVKENFIPVEEKDGGENSPILLSDEKIDEEVVYYENKLKESNELLKKLKRDIVTKKEEFILQKVVKQLLRKLYSNFIKRKEGERKIKSLKKFIYSENLFISKICNNFFYLTNVMNNSTFPIGGQHYLNNHSMAQFYSNQINDTCEGHFNGGYNLTCVEKHIKNNDAGLSTLLPLYKFYQGKGILPSNVEARDTIYGRRRNTFSILTGMNPTLEMNKNYTNLKKRSYKSRLIENLQLNHFNKRRVILSRSSNFVQDDQNDKNCNFGEKWGKRYSDGFSLNRIRDTQESFALDDKFNGEVPTEGNIGDIPQRYEQINWMPNEGASNVNLSALNLLHDKNIFGKSENGNFIRRVHDDKGEKEDQAINVVDVVDVVDMVDMVDALDTEEYSLDKSHYHALPNLRMKRKTIDNCYIYANKQNGDNFLDYYQDVFSRGHYDVKGDRGEEEKTQRVITISDPSQRLLCVKSEGETYQQKEAPQRESSLCNGKYDQRESSPLDSCTHTPIVNTSISSDAFPKERTEFVSSMPLEGRVPHEGCNIPREKRDHISYMVKKGSQELTSALANVLIDGEDCLASDTAKKEDGTIGAKYDNGDSSVGTDTGMYSNPCDIPIKEESKENLLPPLGRTDQHWRENGLKFNLAPTQMSENKTRNEDVREDPMGGVPKEEVTEMNKTVPTFNGTGADGVKKRQSKFCSIKSKSAEGNSRIVCGVSNIKRAFKERENKSNDASMDGTSVAREMNITSVSENGSVEHQTSKNMEMRNINSGEESQMRRKITSIDTETKLVKKTSENKLSTKQTNETLHHTVLVQKEEDTSHKTQGTKVQMDPTLTVHWNNRSNRDEANCWNYGKPNEGGEETRSNNLQYGMNQEDFKKIEKIHEESINNFKNKMNDIGMNSESFSSIHMMEKKIKGYFVNSVNYDADNNIGEEFPYNKGNAEKKYKILCMKNCHKYGVSGLCVKGSNNKNLTIFSSSINNIKLWDGKKAVWNYDHVNLKNEKSTFINSIIVSFQENCFFAGINSYVHLFDIRTNPVSLQKYYYSDKNDGSLLISLLNDKSDYVPFLLQNGGISTFSGARADGDYTYEGVHNLMEHNASEDVVRHALGDNSLKHLPSKEWKEEDGGNANHEICNEWGNQKSSLCYSKTDGAEEGGADKLKHIRDVESFQSEYCICACGNENFIKVFDIRKNDDNMWLAKIPITNKIEYITQIPMKKNGKNITKDSNILKNIIIASRDKTVKIWKKGWVSFYPPSYDWCTSLSNFSLSDLMKNKGIQNRQDESTQYANNLLNYDSLIVSGSRDSHLRFWLYATDSTTNEFNRFMKIVKNAHMVDITSIAKYKTNGLVTTDRDGFIQMWDCNLFVNDNDKALLDMDIYTNQLNLAVSKIGKTLRHSSNAINKVICYENHFLTASSDGSIKIFSEK
ncbi:kinesin-4, putative [Plasmodium knowlesi strain H]|uniref:Kinesin-4, putative n=3 Tax=Plasmodium knowlesi TaxID=5850 RepID=A0A5K1UBD2_PLAKH|nr:kinesin-4, putative [Plasmodium knowlesi strain H]OTN65846.1 putative Kinesin-4 [Plasmodium knowlesi]CAA9987739.1 kinesin-4, putative [Plasmodium knowlesi strain H]SBO27061.1 kinesin-4, putative [Plasmodium knowlesi strain H]SBO29457.1 kinesin-4, putative [Plasmodium knowlesi strain H]VVS77213.1 kinesin-4, putative [Plasmodium knowlesi strain H]|eukprot:XP_002258736.1 kinesin-like protein, putative [Plasmodium knowlesi strain H]